MASTDIKKNYSDKGDVRAEFIAADYVEEGIDLDDIGVKPRGTFKRSYGRDVLKAEINSDEDSHERKLEIEVSREGIYDMLPEGLIHQPDPARASNNLYDIIENIRRTRKEEEDTRKFFYVIEKELYRQRILIELEERKALDGYSDYYQADLFFQIWSDLSRLKREYINTLIQVLPRAYMVTGNIELTCHCFERVLGEKVEMKLENVTRSDASHLNMTRLGESNLGVNAFAGDVLVNYFPIITIAVGPVKRQQLKNYLETGSARQAIDVLCNYLLPAEADVKIEVCLKPEEEGLFLKSEKFEAVLGFTSRI